MATADVTYQPTPDYQIGNVVICHIDGYELYGEVVELTEKGAMCRIKQGNAENDLWFEYEPNTVRGVEIADATLQELGIDVPADGLLWHSENMNVAIYVRRRKTPYLCVGGDGISIYKPLWNVRHIHQLQNLVRLLGGTLNYTL